MPKHMAEKIRVARSPKNIHVQLIWMNPKMYNRLPHRQMSRAVQ
jgi:hypothetical protein